jgi:heme exporter protein D
MSGVVTGGWSFVWAAYGLTALGLGVYTLSVIMRYRKERP